MKHLFIVGAQRSGSTYLYNILDEHPQIAMIHPVRPEPKFFLHEKMVALGKDFYIREYFNDAKSGAIYFGEKSTSYIESIDAARRIYNFYPDARILIVLRDPVERAYSNYRFSVSHNLETLKFNDALAIESERLKNSKYSTSVSPYAYFTRGLYSDYIERYLNIFDPRHISVLIFEEIVGNLKNVQSLYRWLDIDDSFTPKDLSEVFNPSPIKKEFHESEFKKLALDYELSITKLECLLGRSLEIWRSNHSKIILK